LTQLPDYAQGYQAGRGSLREWVAAKVGKSLSIYPSQRGSQLIFASYAAREPGEAALVANTIADIYMEQDHSRSTGPPGERAARYAGQLAELKAKVERAQSEVTAFNQRNGLTDEGDRNHVDAALQATLDERLLAAQNTRRAAEARAAGDSAVSDQVLSSIQTQTLKAQLAAQELRLAQLSRVYAARHPDVIDAQIQVDSGRRALNSALKSYADNAVAELSTARRLEHSLEQAAAEQRNRMLAKSQHQDEGAKYQLELASAQSVYKRALEGFDRIMFASSGRDSNVSLISRAIAPVRASQPKVLVAAVLAAFGALLVGLGVPLAFEFFNRRIRCRDDLERQLGLPVLAEFPRLPNLGLVV
jgi:uncharacterized protein involved in exopolysaccharide biosynthesis